VLPIHQVYFMQTGTFLSSIGVRDADILPAMSLGQIGEIFMMIVLGLMLKRLGFKWVLFIGAMAYFLRYVIFGTPGLPVEVIVASQALHGVCFACYLAAAYIYVDHLAEPDIRHSAQQVFGLVIGGGGPILGGWLNGRLAHWFAVPGAEPGAAAGIDYMRFWYVLAAIGLVATVVLAVLFRSEMKNAKPAA
jgi:MFS family permease